MDLTPYLRRPFLVNAVQITEENIDEIAKLIGISENPTKVKSDSKYIAIDRRVVPNMGKAWVGWYLTVMDGRYRVYSPDNFEKQFALPDEGSSTNDLLKNELISRDEYRQLALKRIASEKDLISKKYPSAVVDITDAVNEAAMLLPKGQYATELPQAAYISAEDARDLILPDHNS